MRVVIAAFALIVAMPETAVAEDVVINNGLAPPNPDNVLDDDTHASNHVYVRNVGCPPGWPSGSAGDPCFYPGPATELELAQGGDTGNLSTYDSSSITMNGGTLESWLESYGTSSATMNDGTAWVLAAYDSAAVTMNGGEIGGFLIGRDSSEIAIDGGLIEELYAYDSSTLTMNNGTVGTLEVNTSSPVTLSGGEVSSRGVSIWGSSVLTMEGGTVVGLGAGDSATVTVTGGTVELDGLSAGGSSAVTMEGGTVWDLYAGDSSTVTINGGTLKYSLQASESSTVTISGGTVEFILSGYDDSSITLTGGVLRDNVELEVFHSSSAVIVGRDFTVDGVPVPYGELTASGGALSGELASGDPIDILEFERQGEGTITLVPPSLSTPALGPWAQLGLVAGLLGMGMGGLGRRAGWIGPQELSKERHSKRSYIRS